MSKRQRFVISSFVLSLGFITIQFIEERFKILGISLLGFLTLILFWWGLWEGLGKDMTLVSLVLPFLFTVSVGFFWFLLPANILARLPVIILFGIGNYVLFLTMNIYTVSAVRTIALLRAARGVGFVLTLLVSFLIFDTILSLRLPLWLTPLLIGFTSFPILLQGFWSVGLEKKYEKRVFYLAGVTTLVIAEMSMTLYFWPVTLVVGSLFLTVGVYMLVGLGQALLEGRLFVQTIKEYLLVGILVFMGMFLATHWG